MKKTLIALGVLATLPSLALSAEVSIYGKGRRAGFLVQPKHAKRPDRR